MSPRILYIYSQFIIERNKFGDILKYDFCVY